MPSQPNQAQKPTEISAPHLLLPNSHAHIPPLPGSPSQAWGACMCMHTQTHVHTYTLHLSEMWKPLSHVWHFETPWAIQSMELSRPEYWSGWLFPSPGDLPNPGIETRSPTLQAILYRRVSREACNPQKPRALFSAVRAAMLGTHMIFRGLPKQHILELNHKIRRNGGTVVLKQHCWDKI